MKFRSEKERANISHNDTSIKETITNSKVSSTKKATVFQLKNVQNVKKEPS